MMDVISEVNTGDTTGLMMYGALIKMGSSSAHGVMDMMPFD